MRWVDADHIVPCSAKVLPTLEVTWPKETPMPTCLEGLPPDGRMMTSSLLPAFTAIAKQKSATNS
jgi:hypothetical protein